MPAPKSCVSLTNVVYAVRSPIAHNSSAMAPRRLLNTESSIGFEGCMLNFLPEVQRTDGIDFAVPAPRHHTGRIGLIDHERSRCPPARWHAGANIDRTFVFGTVDIDAARAF